MNNTKATWIWYPGDFEMMLFGKCMARRYERDVMIAPFWRMDGYYHMVKFVREFTLSKPDRIRVLAEGEFNISFEGAGYVREFDGCLELPAGTHKMSVLVHNDGGLPCLYMEGEELVTDKAFSVTCQDHTLLPVGSWNFTAERSPNGYRLPERAARFLSERKVAGGTLYDFGREVTARLRLNGLRVGQTVEISYGESQEEALDVLRSEQFDRITASGETVTLPITKTFRYVYLPAAESCRAELLEELPPSPTRSKFRSSDKLLQDIWDTAIRTNELTNREFFIDGGKRDRWSWSGDALQSEWISFYSTFDTEIVKRTVRALGGKSPVATHVNHITDYTLYWILSLYDYYEYTGDLYFVREKFPLAEEYMRFCGGRTTEEGFLNWRPNDWVFIDWADMDNRGETSFEQILYAAALRAMSRLAAALAKDGEAYARESRRVFDNTVKVFWKNGAFVHARRDGVLGEKVTRYSNLFAILYGFADEGMRESIVKNVILNDNVQKITTPYMRFYEFIVLCRTGRAREMTEELKKYWGGMLQEGATTFWEQYDPDEKGVKKYAMYDRPYGKSLCHAWGATPVYLIAACLFGIRPAETGYASFVCAPETDVLGDCEILVPTAHGSVRVRIEGGAVEIENENCGGRAELPLRYAKSAPERMIGTENGKVIFRIDRGERVTFVPKED